MTESPITVAQAFIRAINRQDVEALSDLITDRYRFTDSLGNIVEGRTKMRAGWAGYFRMIPGYTIAVASWPDLSILLTAPNKIPVRLFSPVS